MCKEFLKYTKKYKIYEKFLMNTRNVSISGSDIKRKNKRIVIETFQSSKTQTIVGKIVKKKVNT